MSHTVPGARALARALGAPILLLLLAAAGCTQTAKTPEKASSLPVSDAEPGAAQALVKPADLAATLQGTGEKPVLLHVGFRVLYKAGAIPGSRYVGAASTPEGLAALKAAVAGEPKTRAIVVYCGCCPWDHCPNMRPAYQALLDLGYTNVRALYTPHNLDTDWAGPGYPLAKPAD